MGRDHLYLRLRCHHPLGLIRHSHLFHLMDPTPRHNLATRDHTAPRLDLHYWLGQCQYLCYLLALLALLALLVLPALPVLLALLVLLVLLARELRSSL